MLPSNTRRTSSLRSKPSSGQRRRYTANPVSNDKQFALLTRLASALTLKENSTPAKKIHSHALPFVEPQQVTPIKSALVALIVLRKEILILLRREATLVVEAH
jgi:hypothetical protein